MESLSVEEENYVRMSLLLTGISQRAARTFFDSEVPPACLDATMKKEYNKLLDLQKKRIINQSQWNLLFPRFPGLMKKDTVQRVSNKLVCHRIVLLKDERTNARVLQGYKEFSVFQGLPLDFLKYWCHNLKESETDQDAEEFREKQLENEKQNFQENDIAQSERITIDPFPDLFNLLDNVTDLMQDLPELHTEKLVLEETYEDDYYISIINRPNTTVNAKEDDYGMETDPLSLSSSEPLLSSSCSDDSSFDSAYAIFDENDMECPLSKADSTYKCSTMESLNQDIHAREVNSIKEEKRFPIELENVKKILLTNQGNEFRFDSKTQSDDTQQRSNLDVSKSNILDLDLVENLLSKGSTDIFLVNQQPKIEDTVHTKDVQDGSKKIYQCLSAYIDFPQISSENYEQGNYWKSSNKLTEKILFSYQNIFKSTLHCQELEPSHKRHAESNIDQSENSFHINEAEIHLGQTQLCCSLDIGEFMDFLMHDKNEIANMREAKKQLKHYLVEFNARRQTLSNLMKQFFQYFDENFCYKTLSASRKKKLNQIFNYLPVRCDSEFVVCPIHGLKQYFEQMSVPVSARPAHAETMKFEWVRVRSFWSFPSKIRVSPIAMARVGFYYTGKCAECRCFCCGKVYREWRDGDDPYLIHQQISPNCFYLNGRESGNVPIHEEDRIKPRHLVEQTLYSANAPAENAQAGALPGLTYSELSQIPVPQIPVTQERPFGSSQGGDFTFRPPESTQSDGKIPVEIRNMDQHSIDIYLRALKSGSEKRRDINLVIVGKKGAGKTSLVHRLFGEDFANLESTNGIEIHRRQCKIKSDEWTKIGEKDKDKESDINNRIMESVVQQFYINSKDQSTSESLHGMIERQHEYQNIPTSFEKEEILYERIKKKEDVVYERVEEKDDVVTVEVGINTTERDSPVHVLVKEPHQPPSLEWDDSQKTPKQIASEELSALFKSGVVLNDKAEDYTTLTLWDFAGDEEFYATHQTFLNPDAVYLLVANLNDKDNDNENHKHATFKFWMDTIHCYGCRADKRKVDPIKQDTLLNPPVIFVGTHTDELQDQRECSKQLTSHMDKLCKDTSLHLRKCHQISNKSDGNDEFQKIREDIFASATNSKTAEKEYPVKFIQLERVLHSEYTSEKPVRILSFNKVKELACKMSISITDEDELNLFLRYQNEIGNLLYFNDMPEYIILDPQWLADALKCIVTATKFQEKLPYFIEWKEVKETGKIKLKLIEAIFNSQQTYNKDHQSHLIALMEKFDIIINPVEQANRDPLDKSLFFYIPCMMQVNKIEEVDKLFEVEDDCKSMCLCFIFNFLPPYLISHLIVSCLRKYKIASAQQQEGLFKDCCVFDVSDCGCTKLLLVNYGSMIELQIWQWDKETPCQYKEIFNFVKGEMDRIIYSRYRMTTVSFEIKWKCCLTSYTCEYGFKDFGKIKDGKEFHCVEHKKKHKYKDDWFGETSTATGILNDQQHNFARLSMVVLDILGSVLYDRFDLDKNIGQILHSRDQYDISSLYQEHYKLRKHTPSKGRWGGGKIADDVLPSHTCIGDDIERIRLIRNEMQHSGTFALDDARYHILITIIQDMLNRFDHHNNPAGDSYVNRLKEIRKMELTPKDFEDMKAQIQKESSTPHQNFADKIEYHYHF